MKIGIRVYCAVCGHAKAPHGRSIPLGASYCTPDCPGYNTEPHPGCLWPGEREDEFGAPICRFGVTEADPTAPAYTYGTFRMWANAVPRGVGPSLGRELWSYANAWERDRKKLEEARAGLRDVLKMIEESRGESLTDLDEFDQGGKRERRLASFWRAIDAMREDE